MQMRDPSPNSDAIVGKPIALFNASPRAVHAQASLIEIVMTMVGRIVPEASLTISLLGKSLDATEITADAEILEQVKAAILAFVIAIAP
jgi:chromate reductase, NAD(P)H dehydrogenase (quinone)